MRAQKGKKTWFRIRKFFNDLHLWMGLTSGLIVMVICFSGTVYVFNTELREMASPELYKVKNTTGTNPLTAEQIIEKVEAAAGRKVQSLKIPTDKRRTWQVSVKAQSEDPSASSGSPGTLYAVDPYDGQVVGDISNNKNRLTEFMRTMFSLHRWLLLDRIENPIIGELPNRKLGSYITGTATILFTLGVVTGLIIWFPQKIKTWRQGLKIKWDAKWKRLNHDLHNTLAFYSLIFLFIMGATGPQWSFPWYREGLQKTLGTYRAEGAPRPNPVQSTLPDPSHTTDPLSVEYYLASAGKVLPYSGDYTIVLARDSSSAIGVSKNKTGFFAPSAADRLSLDQYTGAVIAVDIFKEKPFNERVAGSIKALHLGDVYGTFTKILYFITCLIATSLPVTGTIIWINKLKKKRKKARSTQLKGQIATSEILQER